MNMIHGAERRALRKASLTIASPSPTYIEKTSAPLSENMGATLAAARASVVLQQPGGPTIRMPRGGFKPRRPNASARKIHVSGSAGMHPAMTTNLYVE
eukprot:scaffold111_cov404-Prasinococcus_capsulatus_cf.AAC.11